MRVLLLFGSFNPIHNGHIALAQELLRRDAECQVWFVISPQNPLKESSILIDAEHRLQMARLAVEQSQYADRMTVCDIEFSMPVPSYTIDTLDELLRCYPDDEFCLVIGADNVDTLDSWRCADRLMNNYKILVYPREGFEPTRFLDKVQLLSNMPFFDYSSTEIRDTIRCDATIDNMICSKVKEYIKANKLWT